MTLILIFLKLQAIIIKTKNVKSKEIIKKIYNEIVKQELKPGYKIWIFRKLRHDNLQQKYAEPYSVVKSNNFKQCSCYAQEFMLLISCRF